MEALENINSRTYQHPSVIPKVCFRAYDIRGPVDSENLTPDLTYAIGRAIGAEAIELGEREIVVGRDGRLSGLEFTYAMCKGLLDSGLNVIYIGLVPTPVLYFATYWLSARSGVMITASHNPGSHNGFKIVLQGKTLTDTRINLLYQRICDKHFVTGKGTLSTCDVKDDYIKYITDHIHLARPMKVVVDCGNGAAGEVAPLLFKALGCEVIELFCEIDGNFPNHHPDPTVLENLTDIINTVKKTKADIGFAFDGDADRLGIVLNDGEIVLPDRQMMLFVAEILKKHPGAEIIFDVKCSRNLPKVIEQHGGKPLMWRTGHSMIKAKLFERDDVFAGELSGHLFFKDEWFGFDDGMYVGARLLRILSQQTISASEVFAALPNSVNTPELKLAMPEEAKVDFMQKLINASFPNGEKITIDGLRVEFVDGWALVRPSNTSPYLILRFEADTATALARIQKLMREQLLKIDPKLVLPF